MNAVVIPNAPAPSLPNEPFFSWLRTHTTLFVGQMIGLLSVVSVPIALIYYSIHGGVPLISLSDIRTLILYLHLAFLGLFIAKLISMLDNNSTGRYRAGLVHEKLGDTEELAKLADLEAYSVSQVKKFKRRFLWFWCAMFFLYLVLSLQPVFSGPPDPWMRALRLTAIVGTEGFAWLAFALNNLSLIFIFSGFVVLYVPVDGTPSDSATPDEAHKNSRERSNARDSRTRAFPGFTRNILIRLYPKLTELELRQRTLLVDFVVLVIGLTMAFPLLAIFKIGIPTNWSEYPVVFDALSGTLNAIVMARLVARLDSKLIGLPSWLICILYFYAGIQPLFVVFELQPDVYAGIKTAVLLVVFLFKIYFFLIIVFALQTGRVFNYFFCSRILNDHVRILEGQRDKSLDKFENAREIWFKYLGWIAMILFAGSLLYYTAHAEETAAAMVFSSLSKYVAWLHIPLIVAIFVVIWGAQRKDTRAGYPSSDPSKYEALFNLRSMVGASETQEAADQKRKDLTYRTVEQIGSFTRYFRLFWFSLLLLYFAMSVDVFIAPPKPIPLQTEPPNRGEAVLQFRRFEQKFSPDALYIGDAWSASGSSQREVWLPAARLRAQERRAIPQVLGRTKFPIIYFVLNNFTVLIVFWCFAILYVPHDDRKFSEKHQLLRNYSLLIAALLTVLPLLVMIFKSDGFTKSDVDKIPTILGAIGGTLNAVAFALLFARLDSRLIGLKSSLISILYGYAAVQPLFVTFAQPSNLLRAIATSAMMAAFVFKICLVLMVGHVRRPGGGLIDYLWFFPVLHKCVNSVYGNQFEIRTYRTELGLFAFSIFDNNIEKYSSSQKYTTKGRCDQAVESLVEKMKHRKNYARPQSIQGTYWLTIRQGAKGKILCESTALKSEDERIKLIDESIEKVPSCKYARG